MSSKKIGNGSDDGFGEDSDLELEGSSVSGDTISVVGSGSVIDSDPDNGSGSDNESISDNESGDFDVAGTGFENESESDIGDGAKDVPNGAGVKKGEKKKRRKYSISTNESDGDDDDSRINPDAISDSIVKDEDDVSFPEQFQKMENEEYVKKMSKQFVNVLAQPSFLETQLLSEIHRDTEGNICDPFHQTPPILFKYERTRILGERTDQLNAGAKPFVSVTEELKVNNYLIALKELEAKKIPFIVQRPLPDGTSEFWKLEDLEII